MEEVPPTTDSNGQACDEVVRTLAAQRAQVQNFVAAHQRRLRQAEAELARQLSLIGEELARDQHRAAQGQSQLAHAQSEVTEGRAELGREREQLESTRARLRQEERELEKLRSEHATNAEELERQRQRLQEKFAEVENAGEALAAEQQSTKLQRRRIAQEFKAQHAAQLKELQRQRDELKFADESLRRQLDDLRQHQTAVGEATQDDLADMKRRYDMALEDLREQRQRSTELEQKLAEIPKGGPTAAVAGDGMDWEAQKRRMLAAWEANSQDDSDDERRVERLKIQEVIAKTDAAMARKEQELDDLRRHLAAVSENQGAMAASAAASDALLSHDEAIRAERARLQQLQLEWEEKLRRAEVELSVERAKMARQRAEIEERQRQLQELQAEHADEPADAPVKEKKPQRGRWLTRLGLKEDESE